MPAQPEGGVDLEQLQLIQLCFGEHEFGVAIDNDSVDPESEPSGIHNTDANSDSGDLNSMDEAVLAFDFDPVLFVHEKLGHGVPLESLCNDLDTFANYLDNAILRHVNTDVHDAFVKVSGHLVGMQDELRGVQQPLVGAEQKVESAMERLSTLQEEVRAQVEDATEIELTRLFDVGLLKLLLLHDVMGEQLESLPPALHSAAGVANATTSSISMEAANSSSLLTKSAFGSSKGTFSVVPASTAANSNNHTNSTSTTIMATSSFSSSSYSLAVLASSSHALSALGNMAATLQQLKALCKSLPQLSSRTRELEEATKLVTDSTQVAHRVFGRTFLALYEAHHTQSPNTKITAGLCEVMRVYQTADAVTEFCRMYRESILRPFLESVLSWRAATQARQSLEETVRLLTGLRQELQEHVLPLLPLLREAFGGVVLPVPMIVWPTVCEALVKKMVALYDVGIPEAFQQRYKVAHELFALMEESCASAEELAALMHSPDLALWRHKWNTDVYATMRANELTKRVDETLTRLRDTPLKQIAEHLEQRNPQEGVKKESDNSSSGAFYLEPFMTLHDGLQWLLSPSVYLYVVTPKLLREAATLARHTAQAVLTYFESSQGSSELRDWLHAVTAATADLTSLASYLEGPFRTKLEQLCGQSFPDNSPFMQLLTVEVCGNHAAELQRAVQTRIAEECAAGLQNIRSVKSTYSHTRRPFPTTASWYVPSIVEPLQRFEAVVRSALPPTRRQEVLVTVAEGVATRFRAIAKETLLTAKKTEESWEKLRRRKETAGRAAEAVAENDQQQQQHQPLSVRPTPETASDRDKMTLQLYLDARAFMLEVEKLVGVKEEPMPAFVGLLKLLRRASWILGEDIPEPPDIDEADT